MLFRSRTSISKALARGMARGEIRSDIDIDVMIDLLTAPAYFRVLFRHARISRSFIETVVDYALRAAGFRQRKSRKARRDR